MKTASRRLIAEFEPQTFIQLIFPHAQSDWAPYLDEASATFAAIARTIAAYQPCLVVCDDVNRVRALLREHPNLHLTPCRTDDTWARDCSAITVEADGEPLLLDWRFNGWGGKFDASRDDAMTRTLAPLYGAAMQRIPFELEGGAIETDGQGSLLGTSECLCNPNRNDAIPRPAVEAMLREKLGITRFLWLDHGYLAGDDTDSHIDTLARFVDPRTICYVQCTNPDDEHFTALQAMERQLRTLRTALGTPYRLIPLPLPEPVFFEGQRLPATYANFLIINGAVLVPTYNDRHDAEALACFRTLFPDRDVIGIDCSVLIRQHGSLHCVTMQFYTPISGQTITSIIFENQKKTAK